jgi:N-acetyl-anhydromuramyl-L-alanine amidase AmpD
MSLDLSKIKQVPLSASEYYKEKATKTQIVLHHTAGNSSAVNVMNDWNKDKRGRIATCVSISGKGSKNTFDGEIVQGFSSKHWAYHLGVKSEVFASRGLKWMNLDKISIGVEICNWGALDYENGKFLTYVDTVVDPNDVIELAEPFKGKKFWHKYTDAQIESVKNLLLYWRDLYGIDLTYDYDKLFTVNNDALTGKNGLYTHNSYRKDKVDISPQENMIEMLKSL